MSGYPFMALASLDFAEGARYQWFREGDQHKYVMVWALRRPVLSITTTRVLELGRYHPSLGSSELSVVTGCLVVPPGGRPWKVRTRRGRRCMSLRRGMRDGASRSSARHSVSSMTAGTNPPGWASEGRVPRTHQVRARLGNSTSGHLLNPQALRYASLI